MNWKSTLAVLAGIGVNFLAIPVDVVMHAAGVFPVPGQEMSDGLYALAFSYRLVFAVGGGWVVARMAPGNPMKLALVLAGIGVVMSGAGAAAMWKLGHQWYPLSLVAICFPATWAGAKLQMAK